MKVIGVDLHGRQQAIAVLDDRTGELVERVLQHEGNDVREFYSTLPRPALVGIEATETMHWFLRLLKNSKSITGSAIPHTSERPNPASRNTIDAMLA